MRCGFEIPRQKVFFKRLDPRAIIPEYKTPGAAGFDIATLTDVLIRAGEVTPVKTGLAVMLPIGTEMQIRPRSGMSVCMSELSIANSPGTIDSDYRGEIKILIKHSGEKDILLPAGMRIAQAIIAPVIRCDLVELAELSKTERGEGGFGSTGMLVETMQVPESLQ